MTIQKQAEELASKVVDLWSNGKDEEATELCNKKIQALLGLYSPSYVAKDCQRIFRKAIFQASGLSEYKYRERPVSYFTVPKEVLNAVNYHSREAVSNQRDDLVTIPSDVVSELLETAKTLLEKPVEKANDCYEKVIALGLLTGRRCFVEIMNKAEFHKVDSPNLVSFSGQAKGGEDKELSAYLIPVLGVSPDLAIEGLEEVREYLINRPWWDEEAISEQKDYIKRRTNKQIKRLLDRHYAPVLRKGDIDQISAHDLRKLYAAICYYNQKRLNLYRSSNPAFTAFASEILGHSSLTESGQKYKDTKTSESYEKYEIVD